MEFDHSTETISPDDTVPIITIGGTGGLKLPVGTTLDRPTGMDAGVIRLNGTAVEYTSGPDTWSTLLDTNEATTLIDGAVALSAMSIGAITWDMTGFPNRTDTTISVDEATRTVTLAPANAAAEVYYRGVNIPITNTLTYTFADTYGGHYISLDPNTQMLYDEGANGSIRTSILVMYVFWDDVNNKVLIFGDERHGSSRDVEWHYAQHRNLGSVWRSGGGLTYTLSDASAVSLALGNITTADEDLEHAIVDTATPTAQYEQTLSPDANLPILYLSGNANKYVQRAPTTLPWYPNGTGGTYYNNYTGGSWTLSSVPDGSYVVYWLVATNDTIYPIKLVLGRSYHSSLADAVSETFTAYNLPLAECVPLYQITLQHSLLFLGNTCGVKIASVRTISSRETVASDAFVAENHGNLTGRTAADQHPISAITDLQATLDGKMTAIAVTVSTAAVTAAKTTDVAVTFTDGVEYRVLFTNGNSASSLTINGVPIQLGTTAVTAASFTFGANVVVPMVYSSTLNALQLMGSYRNSSFDTQIASTVATGTAPLSVASTTAVTNLNADYVDGLHGAQLLRSDQSGTMSGTLTLNNLIFANPGIGNSTTLTFTKTNDTASIKVTEVTADVTEYAFMMGDNPQTADKYYWEMSSWTGPHADWRPLSFSALQSDIVAQQINMRGRIQVNETPFYMNGSTYNAYGAYNSAPAITIDVSGFNLTYRREIILQVNASLNVDVYVDQGVGNVIAGTATPSSTFTPSGSPQATSANVLVTITPAGLVSGMRWQFSVYPANGIYTNLGNKFWHQGNDGTGSGLDADLFHGLSASSYQLALQSGTNIKTINGSSILGSGNLDIAVGTAAGLPIITATGGVLSAGSFGTGAGTFCQGNDSRLSDTRTTPNALTLKFNSGTTEGTDQYTFNGSATKTVNIVAGANITLTEVAGQVTIAATGGGGTPGGTTGEIQYNAGGTFAGAANVEIDNNDIIIRANAAPVSPPSDAVKLFGKQFGGSGGRAMVAAVGPSGMDYVLQPALWRQGIAIWRPPGNATTVPGVFGFNAPTAVGTATARNVATTNALTRAKRLGYVSTTTAGALSGHYSAQAQFTVGTGTSVGGFLYSCRFGVSDATVQTAARHFVGLTSSVAAPANVDPATLTNAIGIGKNAADTNWFIYYGGSVAQTRINLGVNFPVNNTDIIDITLWSPPNQNGVIYYHVTRITAAGNFDASGVLGPGTAGTTLPANTTLIAHRAWRTNNTVPVAVGIDVISVYIETDW